MTAGGYDGLGGLVGGDDGEACVCAEAGRFDMGDVDVFVDA